MHSIFCKCLYIIISVQICGIYSQSGSKKDYCQTQTFVAECGHNEVIQMDHALYGRMQTGKCIKVDNNIGCASDELQTFDNQCSGQQTCDFPVLNQELVESLKCLLEMSPYLEAAYSCVRVYKPSRNRCTSPETIEVTTQSTVNLASTVSSSTSCGSRDTPWLLNAKPGQRLYLSMTDYAWQNDTDEDSVPCRTYGYIVDADNSVITICGGQQRTRHLLSSQGHQVQLMFEGYNPDQRFMVHVKAVGCPDKESPPHTTMKRNGSRVTITCPTSGDSWNLRCVDNTWLGVIGSCDPAPTTTTEYMPVTTPSAKKKSNLPVITQNHVIVFTVACFTLLACTIIIILGVYCTRRYGAKAAQTSTYQDTSLGGNSSISKATPVCYRPVYTNEMVRHGSIDLLTHTPVLERRQNSCPNILDIPCDNVDTRGPTHTTFTTGYPTVPRQNPPVLYYIQENPEEENPPHGEKMYQSLQRENGQLLG